MQKSEAWYKLYLVLAGLFVAGVVLCLVGAWLHSYPLWSEFAVGLGTAIVIAVILAGTIDHYFKSRLLKDAFEAVFGYVLPEYFREELNRIVRAVFIANQARLRLDILSLSDELVEITWTSYRELENITDHKQIFKFEIGLDDFGFPGKCSKILDCRIRLQDQPEHSHSVMAGAANSGRGRDAKLESKTECKEIMAREKFSIYQKVSEIHRMNGTSYWIFFQPCRNPEITINPCPGIEYLVEFLHPNITMRELAPNVYKLKGTFLPYQPVIVRWWPKGFNAKEHGDNVRSTPGR